MIHSAAYERYHRQIILNEMGEEGQQQLLLSKVLVVGAGGLGCGALPYLVAAGVGTIGIIDDDIVSISNLHRQTLYTTEDIGLSKVICARKRLEAMNPEITLIPYRERLTTQNALQIIAQFDYIMDCTDNFVSRYMINDACVLLKKPLVYGAVSKWEGQVAVFCCQQNNVAPVNYRDLFPHPPSANEVPNCAEAGVLGVLPGIIGAMLASETIKLITGIGQVLINKMLSYSALTNFFYEMELTAVKETANLIPASEIDFKSTNYEWLCGIETDANEISLEQFVDLLHTKKIAVIDVRELNELPNIVDFDTIRIPLSILSQKVNQINEEVIVFVCQSGKRSMQAVRKFSELQKEHKKIFSLKGGILQWMQERPIYNV